MFEKIIYPIYFPIHGAWEILKGPIEFAEKLDDVVRKYGETEVQFNGKYVVILNDQYNQALKEWSSNANADYKANNKNFD